MSYPKEVNFESFGEYLKYIRLCSGLTIYQAAEKINISVTSLSNIESNKAIPRMENLKKFAKAYNVPIYEIAILKAKFTPKNNNNK